MAVRTWFTLGWFALAAAALATSKSAFLRGLSITGKVRASVTISDLPGAALLIIEVRFTFEELAIATLISHIADRKLLAAEVCVDVVLSAWRCIQQCSRGWACVLFERCARATTASMATRPTACEGARQQDHAECNAVYDGVSLAVCTAQHSPLSGKRPDYGVWSFAYARWR